MYNCTTSDFDNDERKCISDIIRDQLISHRWPLIESYSDKWGDVGFVCSKDTASGSVAGNDNISDCLRIDTVANSARKFPVNAHPLLLDPIELY